MQSGNFDDIVAREHGLHRGLTTRRMTMIALGGAIGTGLFLGSGLAIHLAGPAVLVSYAIGALIGLLLCGCLAEMALAHPTPGSFGAWAEFYVGPLAGFLVRYAYWTCVVLGVGTEVTAIALYMQFWFPQLPGWPWILGFAALLVLVNTRSVEVFGAVEYLLAGLKLLAIGVFILLAGGFLWRGASAAGAGPPPGGFANYTRLGGFFPHGLWGAWVAVIVAIFSYLSLEMIAVTAGEAVDPQQAVMRALRATLARLVFFYLVTLALVLAVVPWTAAGVAESPFVMVMRALGIPAAAGIFNLVILVAALSAMNSQLYITARMMFSLSRAGFAPRRFGTVTRRGVPVAALLASTAGIALAAALSVAGTRSAFVLMLSIASFGAMFTWMMVFVTHFCFRRAHDRAGAPPLPLRLPGFPATTLAGAALMAGALLTTAFTAEFRLTLAFGLPFLAVLSVIYGVRRCREYDAPP